MINTVKFSLVFKSDPLARSLYIAYKAKKNFLMDKTSCYNIIQQCNRASQLLQDSLMTNDGASSVSNLNKVQ